MCSSIDCHHYSLHTWYRRRALLRGSRSYFGIQICQNEGDDRQVAIDPRRDVLAYLYAKIRTEQLGTLYYLHIIAFISPNKYAKTYRWDYRSLNVLLLVY